MCCAVLCCAVLKFAQALTVLNIADIHLFSCAAPVLHLCFLNQVACCGEFAYNHNWKRNMPWCCAQIIQSHALTKLQGSASKLLSCHISAGTVYNSDSACKLQGGTSSTSTQPMFLPLPSYIILVSLQVLSLCTMSLPLPRPSSWPSSLPCTAMSRMCARTLKCKAAGWWNTTTSDTLLQPSRASAGAAARMQRCQWSVRQMLARPPSKSCVMCSPVMS